MSRAGESKTVLLVDDDPIYATFVRSSLVDAQLRLTIHHVSSLADALAYLRGETPYTDRALYPFPAIILLDINLSSQSGFPVISFLNENGCLKDERTRVIMLTASDRAQDVQEALRLGAISYLIKSPLASTITNLVAKFAAS